MTVQGTAASYGQMTWTGAVTPNLTNARLVPAHEIGHSLGLYHSHGLECGAVTIRASCLTDPWSHNEEYGNAWDVMGNNGPGDGNDSMTWFSARQALLGWLSGSRVKTVTASGTYSLVPLGQAGTSSPQVLVIKTPLDTYYVEYRRPIGQDAFMAGFPAATTSVHVNVSPSSGSDTGPFAPDFTPHAGLRRGRPRDPQLEDRALQAVLEVFKVFADIRREALTNFVLEERRRVEAAIRRGDFPSHASAVQILDAIESALLGTVHLFRAGYLLTDDVLDKARMLAPRVATVRGMGNRLVDPDAGARWSHSKTGSAI